MLGDRLTSGDIAIPFFHDFGSCTGNWPTFENATASWVHGPPQTDFAIAWQVRSSQDVGGVTRARAERVKLAGDGRCLHAMHQA